AARRWRVPPPLRVLRRWPRPPPSLPAPARARPPPRAKGRSAPPRRRADSRTDRLAPERSRAPPRRRAPRKSRRSVRAFGLEPIEHPDAGQADAKGSFLSVARLFGDSTEHLARVARVLGGRRPCLPGRRSAGRQLARRKELRLRLHLLGEEDGGVELVEVAPAIPAQRALVVLRHLEHEVGAAAQAREVLELLEHEGTHAPALVVRMHGELVHEERAHPPLGEVAGV